MHYRRMSVVGLVLIGGYAAVLTVIAEKQKETIVRMEQKSTYYKEDKRFVDQAIALWSNYAKEETEFVVRTRFPIAMPIGDEVCVELRLYRGSIGGNPVYCFNEKSGRLTRKYDIVD